MQKGMIKAVVLTVVFFASVAIFSVMTNQVNEDLTVEMADVSLPIVSLYTDNTEINELHGYTEEMDAAYMRDTITPIPENRKLPIKVQTYQKKIDGISYEIRSLDAKRLIANADVEKFTDIRGSVRVELEIQNLLEAGEEYLLIICVKSGEERIYYYTRIMEPVNCHVSETLAFVRDFHNKTFDAERVSDLSIYLERATGDNTTLNYTNLNSSLKQVGWANFGGERLTLAVPSIKEITDTYNVITMEYVMSRVGEDGASEYFNVEEYYRVRYTKQRMYVLDFERTVNEIFRGESAQIAGKYIQLGIGSSNLEYKASDTGNIVAFVKEGELWSYDQNENTLAKVFSFLGYEGIDERENYNAHDIKIVNVDEAGSITYIVYGYMNRGIHEGKVGIVVNRYDSLGNTNEEVLYIPSKQSYEVMKSDLGQLLYVNEGGVFFIMVEGTVYSINLSTFETEAIITGIEDEAYAVSKTNRLFAWVHAGEALGSTEISVMDFTTEQVKNISNARDEYLRPLGFMGEDFVYGIAKISDVQKDAAGRVVFPMYQLNIAQVQSGQLTILKTYSKEGYYISDIEIEDYTIYLNRMKHNGSSYVVAEQDMIMNREGDSGKLISLQKTQHESKQAVQRLVLKKEVDEKSPKLLTPKDILIEEAKEVVLEWVDDTEQYYVYVKGDVLLSTESVSEAIILANKEMGVVIDHNQQCIWKRSRKTAQSAFKGMMVGDEDKNAESIAQSINAMLEYEDINISVSALMMQGETPIEILQNALKDASVLDLTGCNIDEVLYYISNGTPVFAMSGANSAVLLIGYDANHVSIYDPVHNQTYRKNIEDASDFFANAGSVYITYMRK